MNIRSPFYVVQDFLSAKACESLIDQYRVTTPNFNKDGRAIKLERTLTPENGQHLVLSKLKEHISSIEQRYDATYFGTEQVKIIHYPENEKEVGEHPGCESSQFVRKKWVKTKDVDLTGIIWLKDYHDQVPLDPRFEVYGGKLELPAYNFSLVPQRGTLVLFPATPHFITAISPILIGDLYQLKFNMALRNEQGGMWLYQPQNFPCGKNGFLQGWFEEHL